MQEGSAAAKGVFSTGWTGPGASGDQGPPGGASVVPGMLSVPKLSDRPMWEVPYTRPSAPRFDLN